MKKSLIISLLTLTVAILLITSIPVFFGREVYTNIMTFIGCWQVGAWAAKLGDYLGDKYGKK